MRMQKTYRAGHPHGPGREWYENGSLMLEGSRADGRNHGPFRRWYPDGSPAVDAEYHRGQTIHIRLWDEDGEPIPVELDVVLVGDSVTGGRGR
jgi:antitoxin component YwqK of YwqJK toxin-antitoxin module